MKLPLAFQPMTSRVDWCEPNYQVTPYITEFVNTVSNIPLVVFPVVQYIMYQSYASLCQPNLRFLLLTLQVVGVGSTYYHATLSFAGQLVDENGILWSLAWLSAGYWPKHLLPLGIKSRSTFTMCYILVTFCCTVLSISAPEFNQFALMVFGAPFVLSVLKDYFSCRLSNAIYRVCFPNFILGFGIAFVFWGLDKSFCPLWCSLYMPYLHGVWHVLTAYATAYGIVLCIHEDLLSCGYPIERIHLKYMPHQLGSLGIPYIHFEPTCQHE